MVRSIRALSVSSLFFVFVFLYPPETFAEYDIATASPFELGITHPRPWDLSIRAFVGYNDNVPLVPYITSCHSSPPCDLQSFYGGFSINGNYRFIETEQWRAGVGLSFEQVIQGHSIGPSCCTTDAHDFNLTSLSPSVFGRYFFGFAFGRWIMPASAGMTYSYRRDWLPPAHSGVLWQADSHTLQWDLSVDVIRQLKLGLNYSLSFLDFNPAVTLDARDATAHAVGLSGTYSFQGGLRTITLAYKYGTTNASSSNFDLQNSNGIKAQFKTRVYGPVWLVLDAGSTWEDYKGFTGGGIPPPGRKWQRVEEYGPTLLYVLTEHITADLFYRYTGWVSNQRQFEAHRNNGGMGVTYKF
jgi:hypothetical protein